jgi:phosphopantetheine binding protein
MAHAFTGREPERTADVDIALMDSVLSSLSELVAALMGAACSTAPPRPHLSFLALGGTEQQADEVSRMVNALFGLTISGGEVMRSPTPDSLARTIAIAWFEADGTVTDLLELMAVIADTE